MPASPPPTSTPPPARLPRPRFERRLRWLGGVIVAIVACLAVLPWLSSRQADATMTQLSAVAAKERAYGRLLELLKDAETGQRGYVITGKRVFLEPYDSGATAVPGALRDLDAQADGVAERTILVAIRQASEHKLGLMAGAIRLRDAEGFAAAARAVSAGDGKLAMDRLRALIGGRLVVLGEQRAALRKRIGVTLGYNSTLGIAASIASVLAIGLSLVLTGRSLRERGEAAEQARHLAAVQADHARRSHEQNARLTVIARMLQAMDSLTDAGELRNVLPAFLPKLLPGSSGAVYLYRNSRDFLQRSAAWGADEHHPDLITPAQCWGLRFGRPHLVREGDDLHCGHCTPAAARPGYEHLCVPMISQGEVLGLLVAAVPAGPDAAAEQEAAGAIAEQLALGTSNINLREVLRRQSTTDELTGLYNRRYFDETLRRELFRAERTGRPLAVVMIDLDHFKRMNDTHGHDAGDAVLRAAGRCLLDGVRRSDIACRYGGEELVLVLPECDAAAAARCAETIRAAIAALALFHRDLPLPQVTASCGVAAWPGHGGDAQALLQAADGALYAAKHAGRDRVCVAPGG